jgi:hypothetical protein
VIVGQRAEKVNRRIGSSNDRAIGPLQIAKSKYQKIGKAQEIKGDRENPHPSLREGWGTRLLDCLSDCGLLN